MRNSAYVRFICYPDEESKIKSITLGKSGKVLFQEPKKWIIFKTNDSVKSVITKQKLSFIVAPDSDRIVGSIYCETIKVHNIYDAKSSYPYVPYELGIGLNHYQETIPIPLPRDSDFIWSYPASYCQWYHDQTHGIIFRTKTYIAKQSISISGFKAVNKEKEVEFDSVIKAMDRVRYPGYYSSDESRSNTMIMMDETEFDESDQPIISDKPKYRGLPYREPQYHQNVTYQGWIADRYRFIKDKCLYGQDNEFNIFRSVCFLDTLTPFLYKNIYGLQVDVDSHEIRLSIGILCLILQLILSTGICLEVYNNWDVDNMFDNDGMIITISFLVFSFISYSYAFTVYINIFNFMEI